MSWSRRIRGNIAPLLRKYRNIPASFLEVGVLDGHTARWLLSRILRHPLSRYYGVDTWSFETQRRKHFPNNNTGRALFAVMLEKIEQLKREYPDKCKLIKGYSADILSRNAMYCGYFADDSLDFVYLDANVESAFRTMQDFYLSWPLLKTGGTIVINNNTRKFPECQRAIRFLVDSITGNNGEIVFFNTQLGVRKISNVKQIK